MPVTVREAVSLEPASLFLEDHSRILERYSQHVSFSEGDCIFEAGSPGESCYFIDEGRVRVEPDSDELASEHGLGFLDAGSVIGEISLLDGLPRPASAFAHTDVRARRLHKDALACLGETNPRALASVYLALGRHVGTKLRTVSARLTDSMIPASDPEIDELVARASIAQKSVQGWSEERIDAVLLSVAQSCAIRARELAEETVRVTRIGNVTDKTCKNLIASMGVYRSLVGRPAGGLLNTDDARGVTEIASPVGVVVGLIPATNPAATAIFKALIAIKGRNALILSFPRSFRDIGPTLGSLIQEALRACGAPVDLVQWVKRSHSRKKTDVLMRHPQVSLVLATGGASMVKAAYRSGTPTIGVGPGNAPALICADADLRHAAECVVMSKSFDNGLVCGSENNLVVVASVREAFVDALVTAGAAVLSPEEVSRFTASVVIPGTHQFRNELVGQAAATIAAMVGITRDYPIQLIVVPADGRSSEGPYAREKMAPLLSLFTVQDEHQGVELSLDLLEREGMGHTAVIHTRDRDTINRFAAAVPASRILANSPASHGVIGFTTGLMPSLTLGCGTFGSNSTTDNVSYRNLLNIKRLAHYIE
jgi:acyl-CoA reductase-like NAD-dependent aldehyde dehydrogenase